MLKRTQHSKNNFHQFLHRPNLHRKHPYNLGKTSVLNMPARAIQQRMQKIVERFSFNKIHQFTKLIIIICCYRSRLRTMYNQEPYCADRNIHFSNHLHGEGFLLSEYFLPPNNEFIFDAIWCGLR